MSVKYKIRVQQGLHFFTSTICGWVDLSGRLENTAAQAITTKGRGFLRFNYYGRDSRRMEAGSLAMSIIPLWPNASTLRLSVQPTGIVCHDVETSRQRALGLGLRSFALAGAK